MRWVYAHPMIGLLLPQVVAIVMLVWLGIRPEWGPRDSREAYIEWCVSHEWRNQVNHSASQSEYWRQRLLERYRLMGMKEECLGTIEALTLGYRDDLKKDIRTHFSRSGAMHVLAVSGMHVGVLYQFLLGLLTLGGLYKPLYEQRVWQCVVSMSVILLLGIYAWVTGLAASVVRSVLMCMLVEVARMTHRNPISTNTLMAAAFLILCFRPDDLFAVGFQLSFAAVAAILLIVPPVKKLIPIYRIRWKWLRRPCSYLWDLVVVSLAGQIGTLPLTMYYFGQMSNYFLLTNMLALPLAGILMILAVLFFTIGWLPMVGPFLAKIMVLVTEGLHRWTAWVDALPGSVTDCAITLPMLGLLYGMACTGILAMRHSLWWLIGMAGCVTGFCILYLQ